MSCCEIKQVPLTENQCLLLKEAIDISTGKPIDGFDHDEQYMLAEIRKILLAYAGGYEWLVPESGLK